VKKPQFRKSIALAARLLFQGNITLTFDQLPFHFHNVSFKKRINFIMQGVRLIRRAVHPVGIPPILQIEPSNKCNLQCLTCATGAGLLTRPEVLMSFDMYRQVIDQVKDHVFLIAFWSWGEPFINKDAFRMISYAKDKGIYVHTSTNGHFLNSSEKAGKIIDSGLDSLIVAVDGIDQQTYEKYRKNGSLQKVIDTIKYLVAERASRGVSHPRITLRFIVMKHNEHQVEEVEKFAQDLGVDALTFRSAIVQRSDIDLKESLTPLSSDYQRFKHTSTTTEKKGSTKPCNNYCHRPYANLTVFSNGDVVSCENDFNATLTFGNVGDQPIHEILSSGKAREFYKSFRKDLDQFTFCKECENRYLEGSSANVRTIIFNREICGHEKTN
jgi:radical SAM protein with 4Fe4S-binding SPASM domain